MSKILCIIFLSFIFLSCAQDPQLFKKEKKTKKLVTGKHIENYHQNYGDGFQERDRFMIETEIDTFEVETFKEYFDIQKGDYIGVK